MALSGTAGSEDRPLFGVMLLITGVFLASLGDTIAKLLGQDMHVMQIVWARYSFSALTLLPFLVVHMRPAEILRHFRPLEMFRALALVGITGFYFGAIQFMPLADALGLLFIYPLVATGLAFLFLGERVTGVVIGLSVVSFAGALLVIRPGFGEVNIGALFAVLAALAVATNLVINRKLAGTTPIFAGIVFATFTGLALTTIAAPFFWTTPTFDQWTLMITLGVLSSGVTWMLYSAFSYGPTSVIAPFGYTEILSATALGYFVFGEFPDSWTITGITVICVAGIVMATRNKM